MRNGGSSGNTVRPGWALGLCDRCGFTFKLNQLKEQIFDDRPLGILVCDACNDVDNPQLQLGRQKIFDPQTLQDPRPDVGKVPSTSYFGWMPVGSPLFDMQAQCELGTVTVLIE